MKGLDPQYYQHQIHLHMDSRPIQPRRYRMNPNYLARVKEEIDKLLQRRFHPTSEKSYLAQPNHHCLEKEWPNTSLC